MFKDKNVNQVIVPDALVHLHVKYNIFLVFCCSGKNNPSRTGMVLHPITDRPPMSLNFTPNKTL